MRIEIRGVHKTFVSRGHQVAALGRTELSIGSGEFVTLLGPSGCGKTTLLRIVAGLEQADGGEVTFVGERRPDQPLTTMVWQNYALFPWRTVIDNVAFALEMRGVPRVRRHRAAQPLLHLVGLQGFEHLYPEELSGGMKQRVALARALCADPAVLLMDEPLAALDAQTRLLMQGELLRIWERYRKTVLYVTHSLEEAVFLADRVAIMTRRPGRIKAVMAVDLPRPRTLDAMRTPQAHALTDRCWDLLKEELPMPPATAARAASEQGAAGRVAPSA